MYELKYSCSRAYSLDRLAEQDAEGYFFSWMSEHLLQFSLDEMAQFVFYLTISVLTVSTAYIFSRGVGDALRISPVVTLYTA